MKLPEYNHYFTSLAEKQLLISELFELLKDEDIYILDSGSDSWDLLSKLIDTEEDYQELCKVIQKEIDRSNGWSKDYNTTLGLQTKIPVLKRMGKEKEADQLIDENLHMSEMREIRVKEAIEHGELDQAKKLIKTGIEQAIKDNHPGTKADWESQLLEILITEGDEQKIMQQALANLYSHQFSMDNFLVVKKYTNTNEWPQVREQILSNDMVSQNKMQILHNEGMIDELFCEIEQNGHEFYDTNIYFDSLAKHDKKRLVRLMEALIKWFMEYNIGRSKYQLVAKQLRNLQRIGAKKETKEIASFLRKTYRNRRAMIDELSSF